jgi:hypothetical protein
MMTHHSYIAARALAGARMRTLPRAALGAALLAAVGACDTDRILRVEDPGAVRPEDINSPAALPAVLAAAVGDFAVAYTGSGDEEGQVLTSGLLADEWRNSDTFGTRIEVDRRDIRDNNATIQDVFRQMQRARSTAERAAEAFGRLDPNSAGQAESLNLAGFSYILFAENYCSAVPFSSIDPATSEFRYGAPLTTAQMLDTALARFDAALAATTAAESPEQVNLASVGRGRALLNMGRFAEAAAAVAAVPSDFTYLVEHSENTSRQWNGVWEYNQNEGRWSVADQEGGNGLPYISSGDPRTESMDTEETGFDGVTPLFTQQRYPDRESDAVLASGAEARLIEAEAALQAGGGAAFLTALNAARASAGALPALTAASVPAAREGQVDLLFRERAFTLWLTSHRLGDMRRLVRQYGRAAESVFPTGTYPKGGSYGADVSFPVPVDERNNPEFSGIQSCDNTQP